MGDKGQKDKDKTQKQKIIAGRKAGDAVHPSSELASQPCHRILNHDGGLSFPAGCRKSYNILLGKS